jgi:hypothetical protein
MTKKNRTKPRPKKRSLANRERTNVYRQMMKEAGIPIHWITDPIIKDMTQHERELLVLVTSQYDGTNNGHITVPRWLTEKISPLPDFTDQLIKQLVRKGALIECGTAKKRTYALGWIIDNQYLAPPVKGNSSDNSGIRDSPPRTCIEHPIPW